MALGVRTFARSPALCRCESASDDLVVWFRLVQRSAVQERVVHWRDELRVKYGG